MKDFAEALGGGVSCGVGGSMRGPWVGRMKVSTPHLKPKDPCAKRYLAML